VIWSSTEYGPIGGKSQEEALPLAVKILYPGVMKDESQFTGFDTELWEQIAQHLKLEFNYRLSDQWRIFSDLVLGKAPS
jgi:hypothetical protein